MLQKSKYRTDPDFTFPVQESIWYRNWTTRTFLPTRSYRFLVTKMWTRSTTTVPWTMNNRKKFQKYSRIPKISLFSPSPLCQPLLQSLSSRLAEDFSWTPTSTAMSALILTVLHLTWGCRSRLSTTRLQLLLVLGNPHHARQPALISHDSRGFASFQTVKVINPMVWHLTA